MDDGGGIELRAANGAAPSTARDDDDDFAAAAPASCAALACQYLTRCCRRRRSQRWSPLGQVDFDPAAAALARPKKKRSHRWKAPGASQFAKYAAKTPRREAYAHRSESDERAVANPLRPENRAIGRVERPSGRCYGLREQRDRQRAASSKIVEKRVFVSRSEDDPPLEGGDSAGPGRRHAPVATEPRHGSLRLRPRRR